MLSVHKKHFYLSPLTLYQLCETGIYGERRKVKITCMRKHRERTKASISKAFDHQPIRQPPGEHAVRAFITSS